MLVCTVLLLASTAASPAQAFLRHAASPPDYLMATLEHHRIVIVGESHWIAHEVALVRDVVPRLAERGILLGMEMLPASKQADLDAVLTAKDWDQPRAIAILRAASWPYTDYLEILHAAWSKRVRVVALGPPANWRETLLSQGKTYDGFMADLVTASLAAPGSRMLVYCGLHHGFTRYTQPEVRDDGSVDAFMDRMGNMLRRRDGQEVFLVMLHRPIWCGHPASWGYCLPFDGAVDCAAPDRPVGFDVAGSPFADLTFDRTTYYAHGYASLRFAEFADGDVWSGPVESFAGVGLIPLDAYAPGDAALAEVIAAESEPGKPPLTREALHARWTEEAARLADAVRARRWAALAASWRTRCP
ncbi:MAG TPA: ChaN family lipoprotein [Candidatus Polarisedimenticolaceae bacterium]|nr:ChaN family lipoprotein [Candidatus Polarisedimenticolaceae bacterium]